jgi:small GTP-binding protein
MPVITQKFREFISDSYDLLTEIKIISENLDSPFIAQSINQQSERLRKETLLIAVVGEVKAGKSTFINTLLKSPICKTDIDICTKELERISYAEESSESRSDVFREVSHCNELLKGLAIIDTPGNNAIIEHHNAIAHDIVPKIDLVFFVLHQVHIAQQSTWDFVDFVATQWHRKIIFVLTHCDQVTPQLHQRYLDLIAQRAIEHGIPEPAIFSTAIDEIANNTQGFEEIRQYLKQHFGELGVYQSKIKSIVDAFQVTITEIIAINETRTQALNQLMMQVEASKSTKNEAKWGLLAESMSEQQRFWFLQKHHWQPQLEQDLVEIITNSHDLIKQLALIDKDFGQHNVDIDINELKQRVRQLNYDIEQQIMDLFSFNPFAKQLEGNKHHISNTNKKLNSSFKSISGSVSGMAKKSVKNFIQMKSIPFRYKVLIAAGMGFLLMFMGIFLLDELIAFVFEVLLLLLWTSPILATLSWFYYQNKLKRFHLDSEKMCIEMNQIYQLIEEAGGELNQLHKKKIDKVKDLFTQLQKNVID